MTTRKPVTISLDPDLIAQVDRIAEIRGETRTAVIERSIRNNLPGEEKFLKLLGNPVARAVFDKVLSSPRLIEAISAVVHEDLAPGEVEALRAAQPRLSEAGRRVQSERASSKKSGRGSKNKPVSEGHDDEA